MSAPKLCAKCGTNPRYRRHSKCNPCRCRKNANLPAAPLAPVDTWMGRFWLSPVDRGGVA